MLGLMFKVVGCWQKLFQQLNVLKNEIERIDSDIKQEEWIACANAELTLENIQATLHIHQLLHSRF